MSRPPSVLPQRPLSSTEELERLEQSITLTLQEIDSNFSKAHRIVTTSILPVVEQYGEHCKAVWDASKFWKQFFEAAANVSLSGYEELAANDETTAEESTTITHDETSHDETSADYTAQLHGDDDGDDENDNTATYRGARDDSVLTDVESELTGSTPRPPATKSLRPQFADLDSPYEALRKQMVQGGEDESTVMKLDIDNADVDGDFDDNNSSAADSMLLAQRTARLPDMSMTPRQSPDERRRKAREEEQELASRQKDPLMHRILDKNYRIQATPHKSTARGISPMRLKVTERSTKKEDDKPKPAWQESSPMSSPEMAVPKLRSAAFLSPLRTAYRSKLTAAASGPRTPGVSVQTPAKNKTRNYDNYDFDEDSPFGPGANTAQGGREGKGKGKRETDEINWDSSDDDGEDLYGGISPPKTINFALPPSKLLQTPAQEASKRIVEDIMLTAGDDLDKSSEYSPTMVKMNANILDDTF